MPLSGVCRPVGEALGLRTTQKYLQTYSVAVKAFKREILSGRNFDALPIWAGLAMPLRLGV